MQTLTPSQAVASARALPERVVKKGKVWLLLAGGAAALFGATIVIENNANFFPAIARANLAMRTNRNKQVHADGSCPPCCSPVGGPARCACSVRALRRRVQQPGWPQLAWKTAKRTPGCSML